MAKPLTDSVNAPGLLLNIEQPIDGVSTPVFGVRIIGPGTATQFVTFFMQYSSTGWVYFWPNTSGVLRYSTTVPSTQDSDGSAV